MPRHKITVLLVSHEASLTGASLFLKRLAKGLIDLNFRVVIFFSAAGPLISKLHADGLEIYNSNKRPPNKGKIMSLVFRFFHSICFIKALWHVKPDVVYSNTIVNCSEVLISRICGFPCLVHMHEGGTYARTLKNRLILQAHISNGMIVGSKYAGQILLSLTGKVGQLITIGVSGERFRTTEADSSSLRVGILGTVHHNKGQLLALEAIAMAVDMGADVKLIVAGAEVDHNYSEQLKKYVDDHGLWSRVSFLGQVESVESFFSSIDVLVVCSYDEVFPTVILEAMRESKLVIATRVGGIPEIIDAGVTGLLYEAGDVNGLTRCLIFASDRTKSFSDIVDNANTKFKRDFEIENSVKKIACLIKETKMH